MSERIAALMSAAKINACGLQDAKGPEDVTAYAEIIRDIAYRIGEAQKVEQGNGVTL